MRRDETGLGAVSNFGILSFPYIALVKDIEIDQDEEPNYYFQVLVNIYLEL